MLACSLDKSFFTKTLCIFTGIDFDLLIISGITRFSHLRYSSELNLEELHSLMINLESEKNSHGELKEKGMKKIPRLSIRENILSLSQNILFSFEKKKKI